jgi:hypothetical protein
MRPLGKFKPSSAARIARAIDLRHRRPPPPGKVFFGVSEPDLAIRLRPSQDERMSDQPGNLVIEMLRAIRGDLADVKADLIELKQRVGLLEGRYASLSTRVDRIAGDVALIKRRLDLVEA